MHECSPKHLRMGTARLKKHETEEVSKPEKSENKKKQSGHEKKEVPAA